MRYTHCVSALNLLRRISTKSGNESSRRKRIPVETRTKNGIPCGKQCAAAVPLLLILPALFPGIGTAETRYADTPSLQYQQRFMSQCLEATHNRKACRCATRAFSKQVPASAVSIGHHPSGVSVEFLRISDEHLALLAPAIEECEARHPK